MSSILIGVGVFAAAKEVCRKFANGCSNASTGCMADADRGCGLCIKLMLHQWTLVDLVYNLAKNKDQRVTFFPLGKKTFSRLCSTP